MHKAYLTAAFGLFLIINIWTIYDGHNWGDDFAQYIHHAINIVEHRPYTSGILLDLNIIVPPGFPMMLSALIFWFGFNLKIFKFLNVILWALSSLLTYDLVASRLGRLWASLVTIWLLSSPLFFISKQNILTDIPFMFFILLFFWSFQRHEKGSKICFYIALFSLAYACLVRLAGFILVAAVVFYLGVLKRRWKDSIVFILTGIAAWCFQLSYGISISDHIVNKSYVFQEPGQYLLKMLFEFYLMLPLYKYAAPTAVFLGPVLITVIIVVIFFKFRQKRLGMMGSFSILYLLGVLLWPAQGGSRYIFPIIIPLTIYLVELLRSRISEKFIISIFIVLILQNSFAIKLNWKFNDDAIFQKNSLEMMDWVKHHLKNSDHYMFDKARALSLFTGRIGAPYWMYTNDSDQWYLRIKPLNISYLIADKHADEISAYNIFNLPAGNDIIYCEKIWENSDYKIFKVWIKEISRS